MSAGTVVVGRGAECEMVQPEPGTPERDRLLALAAARFAASADVAARFFGADAGRVAQACRAMAARFSRGGRLLVFGTGAAASDAQHVAVEFVHPVLVGKRALPALALTSDVAALTAAGEVPAADGFARLLRVLGRESDIAMGISPAGADPPVVRALAAARSAGMLTLALIGSGDGADGSTVGTDFTFVVPSADPLVVQEVHETLYHVLWELVHVFLEHGGTAA